MNRPLRTLWLLGLCCVACVPNQWLTRRIPAESLPADHATTTVLISTFDYTPTNEINRSERRLRKYTNRNLSDLNNQLVREWERYQYPHKIVENSQIDSLYPDKAQYRYVVNRLVTFRNSNSSKATYQYYLYDRKNRKIYRDIGIYSDSFWKTTRILIHKMNKTARAQS